MSTSDCCFLSHIQVSQEICKVVWYIHLFKNFPQFVVIHRVKGFCLVSEAEVDGFLELPCFLNDPMNVGNLISCSLNTDIIISVLYQYYISISYTVGLIIQTSLRFEKKCWKCKNVCTSAFLNSVYQDKACLLSKQYIHVQSSFEIRSEGFTPFSKDRQL